MTDPTQLSPAFQEYDCPSGPDFDLGEEEIVCIGERFPCSGCGGHHVGGADGPRQTAICLPPGDDPDAYPYEFRGVPASPAEKAAWLAEGRFNLLRRIVGHWRSHWSVTGVNGADRVGEAMGTIYESCAAELERALPPLTPAPDAQEQRCGNCRHRGKVIEVNDEEFEPKPTPYFFCDRLKHIGTRRNEALAIKTDTALVVDGSGYFAALCVADDFACNQWEPSTKPAGA